MERRRLGRTGLTVGALGFGCGAVGGLMVRGDAAEQREAVARAIAAGVSYFDTAVVYGDGRSEETLGRVLRELGRPPVVVGTKTRLLEGDDGDFPAAIRRSLEGSLRRLGHERVDLLQLHSRVGARRDLARGVVSADDVAGPIGDALAALVADGLVGHAGMTATGDPPAVLDAVGSGRVETAQVYLNVLNPSAGWAGTAPAGEPDFSGLLDRAAAADVGAIVIRSLAAGAVAGPAERHPNASDPFGSSVAGSDFARDQARAARLADLARELGLESTVELALRFVLAHRAVSTVIVGYSSLAHLEDALRWSERGPLAEEAVGRILAARPAA